MPYIASFTLFLRCFYQTSSYETINTHLITITFNRSVCPHHELTSFDTCTSFLFSLQVPFLRHKYVTMGTVSAAEIINAF